MNEEEHNHKVPFQNMYASNIFTPNIASLKYSMMTDEKEMKIITELILTLRDYDKREDVIIL